MLPAKGRALGVMPHGVRRGSPDPASRVSRKRGKGSKDTESAVRVGTFIVNNETRTVAFPEHHSLLEVLREELGLTGTKHGCELGECGACTVEVEGRAVLSCLLLAAEAEGKAIRTVEGLAVGRQLHPLQLAFAELGAAQCGYCTPGILMAAKVLLDHNPSPSADEIRTHLGGNLCRCTGYERIVEAVAVAAARLQGTSRELDPAWLQGDQRNAPAR